MFQCLNPLMGLNWLITFSLSLQSLIQQQNCISKWINLIFNLAIQHNHCLSYLFIIQITLISKIQMKHSFPDSYTNILSVPAIQEYFNKNVPPALCEKVLIQLIIEAIQNRNKQKHKPVSKNTRFLSPQYNKLLTPKVTQTIPILEPHIIYGKPKIDLYNLDQNPFFKWKTTINQPTKQINNNEEQQYESQTIKNEYKKTKLIQEREQKIPFKEQRRQKNVGKFYQNDYQMVNKNMNHKVNLKNEEEMKKKMDKKIQTNSRESEQQSRGNKKQMNKTKRSQYKNLEENYNKIESKIKHLVNKDKQDSIMKKTLEKHQKMLEDLQKKQIMMMEQYHVKDRELQNSSRSSIDPELIRYYQQFRNNGIRNKNTYFKTQGIPDSDSDSFSCSCSKTLNNQSFNDQPINAKFVGKFQH